MDRDPKWVKGLLLVGPYVTTGPTVRNKNLIWVPPHTHPPTPIPWTLSTTHPCDSMYCCPIVLESSILVSMNVYDETFYCCRLAVSVHLIFLCCVYGVKSVYNGVM